MDRIEIQDAFPLSEQEYDAMLCDRQTEVVWRKLKAAHVAIAGLGGLGSHIAVELARAGVGYLHLIDFDRVEPSNLNRQCYTMWNLGQYKTEALANQLRECNPYIQLKLDTIKVTQENVIELLKDELYICEAFDNPEAKSMLVNAVLEQYPQKVLVAASGMAGYDSSNQIVTRRIMPNFYLCGDGVNAAVAGRGLVAPRVSICAGHQANMMIRVILGEREV